MAIREISPQERSFTDIQRRIANIKRQRERLADGIVSTTLQGRARSTVLRFLPQLREQLQVAPLAALSAEIRGVILDLYNGLPEILGDAGERVVYAEEVENLLAGVSANPEDKELLYTLERLLNEEAERSLNIKVNPEADAFIEEVQRRDPDFAAKSRQTTVAQAQRFLDINGPTIIAIRASLIGSVGALKQLKRDYADIENQQKTIDKLHQTVGQIIRGQELGITSFNTIMGELELVVAAAELVHDAVQASRDFADIVGSDRLERLQNQADALEKKLLGFQSNAESKPLPKSTPGSSSEVA